jgi:hypothetical protein
MSPTKIAGPGTGAGSVRQRPGSGCRDPQYCLCHVLAAVWRILIGLIRIWIEAFSGFESNFIDKKWENYHFGS